MSHQVVKIIKIYAGVICAWRYFYFLKLDNFKHKWEYPTYAYKILNIGLRMSKYFSPSAYTTFNLLLGILNIFFICLCCRLLEKEEEWKADVEASIAMKDARSKIIQMEKEEAIAEVGFWLNAENYRKISNIRGT